MNEDRLSALDISDKGLLLLEAEIFREEAEATDIAETERERLLKRYRFALDSAAALALRNALLATRLGLELPSLKEDENLIDYTGWLLVLTDLHDSSKGTEE